MMATPCVQILKWTIVYLFLIIILFTSIAWFILKTRDPCFRVSSVSVSNFSSNSSTNFSEQLRGRYQIHLGITNPNKKIDVTVEDFNLFVCHGKVEVCVHNAEVQQPIHVNRMSDRDMVVELSLMKKDTPNLNVKMNVRVTYEHGILPTKEKFLDVYCDVGFVLMKNNTPKLQGQGNQCVVTIRS